MIWAISLLLSDQPFRPTTAAPEPGTPSSPPFVIKGEDRGALHTCSPCGGIGL